MTCILYNADKPYFFVSIFRRPTFLPTAGSSDEGGQTGKDHTPAGLQRETSKKAKVNHPESNVPAV